MEKFQITPFWRIQIPAYSVEVLEHYVNYGGDLSGFYQYLLVGDAFEAARSADSENLAALGPMFLMIWQTFPGDSYGSPVAVENWEGLLGASAAPPRLEYLDVKNLNEAISDSSKDLN